MYILEKNKVSHSLTVCVSVRNKTHIATCPGGNLKLINDFNLCRAIRQLPISNTLCVCVWGGGGGGGVVEWVC